MVTLSVFLFKCKFTFPVFFCCAGVKKRMRVIDATQINTKHTNLCIHKGWLKDGYRFDACMLLLFEWKQVAEIQDNI